METDSSPDPSSPPPKKPDPARKRGGQSGNRNAYKHGFYTRAYQKSEQLAISSSREDCVQDEINLIRVLVAKIAQDIQPAQNLSFQENISALHTVSLALARLDSLRHTNLTLTKPDERLIALYKTMGFTDAEIQAEIDEMNGIPSPSPMTEERWVELRKGWGYTDAEIQAEIDKQPPPPPAPKKGAKARGGQPANTNALKHGFYASLFNSEERRRLEKFDPREVDDDITLLRVLIKRAAASVLNTRKDDELTLSQRLTALRVITYAIARLEKLQRTRALLLGPETDMIQQAIAQALDEFSKELGVEL